MDLIIKMLKNAKNTQLKIKICSVIGNLIRHATMIE